MSAAENPTKELTAEFNKAKTAVEKAKTSLEKKKTALKEVEQAAGTTGISLKALIQRQNDLTSSADRARIAQEKMAKATELQGKFKSMAQSSAMALGGIAAAAATAGVTVKQAMNFEDMSAELGKYSDNAKEIFGGIKELTKKYSKSAQDMTDMAASAMQSGIARTKDDVLTLIESQTQAAVAFGMTGDAVGSAWADIQSKMGMNIKETQTAFDIVNKLGNDTTASSEDILNVLQRQGGTMKSLTALNSKQVVAMAGAFRSASTSSEVAATSMGTFISRLTVGSNATKAQQEAFEALGLDAEDMAKQLTGSSESAQKAIQNVFAKINSLSKDKQGSVIGQLFGNESGIKAAVATLAANSDMLGKNLQIVGDKANYAGSMYKEYMARASTTSEALGIAKNHITLLSAEIGQALLPAVKSAIQSFIEIAGKVTSFVQKNQQLTATILKVTGIVVGFVTAFHTLRLAFALTAQPILAVYKAYQWVASGALKAKAAMIANKAAVVANKVAMIAHKAAMIASKVAMAAWNGICKAVTAAQWLWNAAMSANPIGAVIVAITALVAAGVALWKNWDTIKEKVKALWEWISNFFGKIGDAISKAWEKAKGFFSGKKSTVEVVSKAGGGGGVRKMATGGIATGPTLALIGEGRESEAVLPLSKLEGLLSNRSRGGSGGGISVNFAPTINISGGSGNAYAEVERGLKAGQQNLKKELEKLLRNQQRLSYV